jgi:hypothetical protein
MPGARYRDDEFNSTTCWKTSLYTSLRQIPFRPDSVSGNNTITVPACRSGWREIELSVAEHFFAQSDSDKFKRIPLSIIQRHGKGSV